MEFQANAEGLVALASSLPLALLGLLLFFLRPRRPENIFFALFSLAWAAQVAAVSLGRLTLDAGLHDLLFRLNLVLELPTALFLVYFASIHPLRRAVARDARGPLLLGLLVLPGALALVFVPDLVITGTVMFERRPVTIYGPLAYPLFFLPFYAAFYYALWSQFHAARQDPFAVASRRARAVFLALALFVSYATTRNFVVGAVTSPLLGLQGPTATIQNGLLFGAGLILIVGMLVAIARDPGPRGLDLTMIATLLLPAAVGAGEASLEAARVDVDTVGLWRIGTVALVVYAIARYELFDLDQRLRAAAVPALPTILILATALVLVSLWIGAQPPWAIGLAAVAGAVANGALWTYRRQAAALVLPAGTVDPSYLRHRRIEVYRAALERYLADEPAARSDDALLRELRRSLGLSERDHERLAPQVRQGLAQNRGATGPSGPPPKALVANRYQIERLLGEGGQARVFLAWDRTKSVHVVVKTIPQTAMDAPGAGRALREARLLARLRHPHIVQIHEILEGETNSHIVMEYADGGNLHGLLQREGPLSAPQSVAFLDQLLSALEAAHGKGIIHRDLKPANLLLRKDGTLLLGDFGVARDVAPGTTSGLTQGAPLGTLLYMSPEQVRGQPVDARTDLYSAGVVLHEMLTGHHYLRIAGRDDFHIRRMILEDAPRLAIKNAPDRLLALLRRSLAKDPARRFQTATEMRAALAGPSRAAPSA